MSKALYRKYRSKSLDEVVGQKHITDTLKKAIENGTISHAYLFTGPRGVGKTSVARILAHEVNGIEYDSEDTHLDIIEIDAASNRRIDEIRDLRDKVNISPTSSKYKVYIIDEVHMLTKEAFNALLKTLEEPPSHVIFILATTEFNKLPDTIVSRTQHFKFNSISENDAVSHLMNIAKHEGVNLDEQAAKIIAQHGGGSFRDSIGILDKIKTTTSDINAETVNSTLGLATDETIDLVLTELKNGTPKSLVELLEKVYSGGVNISMFIKQLAERIKQLYISTNDKKNLALYRNLVEVSTSIHKELVLEIILLESQEQQSANTKEEPESINSENIPKKTVANKEPKIVDSQPEPLVEVDIAPEPIIKSEPENNNQSDDIWEKILTTIKGKYNTLYSVLRMSDTRISNDEIVMNFKFPFHYKKVNTKESLGIINDIANEVSGKRYVIKCVSGKSDDKTVKDDSIVSINNIFGETEVLES